MFEKITFFDTEFANSKNRSICQLALICDKLVDGETAHTERKYLVNPGGQFSNLLSGSPRHHRGTGRECADLS